MFSFLISIFTYALFALVVSIAASKKHIVRDGLAVFPILVSYRVMVWTGGAICALAALHEFSTQGFGLLGIFFATISAATLLLPLQSIAISGDGVESLPVLLRPRVLIPWESITKIETRNSRSWIVIYGDGKSVTFTRLNADREGFECLLRRRVNARIWVTTE